MPVANVDEYIAGCAKEQQEKLESLRQVIRKAAPGAEEVISYAMPTYRFNNRNLIHFAANKKHIGLYPGPAVLIQFAGETTAFNGSRGSIHFSYDQPLPRTLITKMVRAAIRQNKERLAATAAKK